MSKTRARRTMTVISALAAMLAAGTNPVQATDEPTTNPNEWVQACIDPWEDSDAYSFCDAVQVNRVADSTVTQNIGKCTLNGSCSFEVDVTHEPETEGEEPTVVATTITSDVNKTIRKEVIGNLVACVWRPGFLDDWRVKLRKNNCQGEEIDAQTAVDDGLTQPRDDSEDPIEIDVEATHE